MDKLQTKRGRQRRFGVVAAGLSLLLLAACSSPGNTSESGGAPAASPVKISQWYHEYGEAGTKEAVEKYAADFNASQDAIKVTVTWVVGDYETKLNAALLAGEGPDLFESAPVGERIVAGQVSPVDDLFGEALSDFNPKNIAAVTVGQHIYGVPMSDGTGLLFYRKSMLDEAGIKPPATMDDLIAAAKALTTSTQKGLFIGNDGCTSGQLPKIAVWSAGTQIVDQASGEVVLDPARTKVAFEKMKELCATDALLLGAPTDWYDSSAFIDGLTAMQWGGQWTLPAVESALGDDFGVVPWPAADAQGAPATWFGGWYQQVNAKSANIEAAKEFAKWLWIDNTEAQTEWSTAFGSTAPVRQSIVDAAPNLAKPPASLFIKAIADDGHLESGVYWSTAAETALATALNDVVKNGADPDTAIEGARATISAEVDRIKAGFKI
ncbi:MAG: sugar ABC transporter substrate-binding protein [Propionibacteriaceae bacterium]|nr:sugar ABC transporter substrate-binding protein [Propionibacteriaceae bacterium]